MLLEQHDPFLHRQRVARFVIEIGAGEARAPSRQNADIPRHTLRPLLFKARGGIGCAVLSPWPSRMFAWCVAEEPLRARAEQFTMFLPKDMRRDGEPIELAPVAHCHSTVLTRSRDLPRSGHSGWTVHAAPPPSPSSTSAFGMRRHQYPCFSALSMIASRCWTWILPLG